MPPEVRCLVIVAEFEVKAAEFADFIALARRFARECLASEPGCRQFDVVELESPANGALFYETYDDAAAFQAHCASEHLARFKSAFPPMIIGERPLRTGLI